MWPPTLVCLFARSTIAIAFQRTYERMRCSISWSPGMRTCASVGIVLMYAVFAENGRYAPRLARLVDQLLDQEMRAVGTFDREHAGERVQPFARFLRIGIAFHRIHGHPPYGKSAARAALTTGNRGIGRQ